MHQSNRRFVVVVAGGSGKRMGSDVPKQFLEVAGKPILMRTIERFYGFDPTIAIIAVLPKEQFGYWEELKSKHGFAVQHTVVAGGNTRFLSVKNGLMYVDDNSIVAIHDGVRPLVGLDVIQRCFDGAEKFGNAVPVMKSVDSVRIFTERGIVPADRQNIMMVQTPQVFKSAHIKEAYNQDYDKEFTDDATVLEEAGMKIHFVEGNRQNIKITTQDDLVVANAYLEAGYSGAL